VYAEAVAAARLPDGRLQVFRLLADMSVFTTWKTTTSSTSPWAPWTEFKAFAG
jgi:hypothetical protein